MLIMLAPLLLVLTQLAMRYEYRPVLPNEQTVVAMHIKPEAWKAHRDLELQPADDVDVETAALRDEKNSTIYWRVCANTDEPKTLTWKIGDESYEKTLPVAADTNSLLVSNPKRPGSSIWERILHPAEESLAPESPIESIDLQLTPRATPVLGLNVPWWATFFLVSMLVAFIAGKLLGVQY